MANSQDKESFADFLSEYECVELLRKTRWENGVKCPYCNGEEVTLLTPRYLKYYHRYRCEGCTKKANKQITFSDRTKTIFEGTRIPLKKWFFAAYLMNLKQSTLSIAKELVVEYHTADRITKLMRNSIYFTRLKKL